MTRFVPSSEMADGKDKGGLMLAIVMDRSLPHWASMPSGVMSTWACDVVMIYVYVAIDLAVICVAQFLT